MGSLNQITGHREIKNVLLSALKDNHVGHAYLFAGPEGVGKEAVGISFARALLCSHPQGGDSCGQCSHCIQVDQAVHPGLEIVEPQGAFIKIQQIRQLHRKAQTGASAGLWQVIIIKKADVMTREAAGSLLKILEEPAAGTVFILLSGRPRAILPTVLSRCQQVNFQPLLAEDVIKGLSDMGLLPQVDMDIFIALAGGSLTRAVELVSGDSALFSRDQAAELAGMLLNAGAGQALEAAAHLSLDRSNAMAVLDFSILWYRDMLVFIETGFTENLINKDRVDDIIEMGRKVTTGVLVNMILKIQGVRNSLAAGANTRLALEVLFLGLAGHDRGFQEEVL